MREHSKANCSKIVKWIGNEQARFDELVELFLHDESKKIVQRAAWPLSEAVINHPALVQKHLGKILKNLERPGQHDAVKRNTVRLLQFSAIPKKYQGKLMDLCFRYCSDPAEKPAVKADSLTVLYHLSRNYPEILPELKTIIKDRWPFETAAFRARARNLFKEFA